jgi:chitinase
LKALDFDLEEPEYENAAAINNELGAAQILQRNNPGLYGSITVPGTTNGTGYFGQQLLNNAKSLGYTPNNYAIMPFDGGFSGASSQISALQSFNTILMNTFGWSSATAYAHEGISSMNGRTDSAEYFYQSDFQTVLNFAESNHLARYTFWSVNRDRQCNPPNNNGALSGTCSSVAQNDWDFTRIIVQFAVRRHPILHLLRRLPAGLVVRVQVLRRGVQLQRMLVAIK